MQERKCKYYRCMKNKKEKWIQWWSFHDLSLEEIIKEISDILFIYRSDRLDFIVANNDYRMRLEDLKRKRTESIIKKIKEYYESHDFSIIHISFKNWYIELCKGKPDSFWYR